MSAILPNNVAKATSAEAKRSALTGSNICSNQFAKSLEILTLCAIHSPPTPPVSYLLPIAGQSKNNGLRAFLSENILNLQWW
ncbi:MAG: hypothetical protein ICV54_14780 [Nostoc sp. C3-bin3]|nr:hypothetical protein [Nostoc sp. C3-bin3]